MQRQSDEDRADAQKDGAVFDAKVRSSCCMHNVDLVISIAFDNLGHVHTGSSFFRPGFQCCVVLLTGLAI